MTTKIEQDFFKVFGIEPIKYILPLGQNFYWQDGSRIMQEADYKMFKIVENDLTEEDKKLVKVVYPEITDRKLLELICIANKANIEVIGETVEETKNKLLEEMVYWKDDIIYKQIQQLFKEEE